LPGQHAHRQWRKRDQAHLFTLACFDKAMLDPALQKVVGALHADRARLRTRGCTKNGQTPRRLVAQPNSAYLSLFDQTRQSFELHLDGHLPIGPMRLINVDVIRSESLQRVIACNANLRDVDGGRAAPHPRQMRAFRPLPAGNLAGNDNLVARHLLQPASQYEFRQPIGFRLCRRRVEFGRIEEIHARRMGFVEQEVGCFLVHLATEGHRADRET
jgi:hypothetical protein